MPKKIDTRVKLRAFFWRHLVVDEIVKRLEDAFPDEQPPDRTTVARWLREFRDHPPEEVAEDAPFQWGGMKGAPWEGSRTVLDAFAWYQQGNRAKLYGPFTHRFAKWIWRIHQASPFVDDPDLQSHWTRTDRALGIQNDRLFIAHEYSLRELANILFGEPFKTADLDTWLAFQPWQSREKLEAYQKLVRTTYEENPDILLRMRDPEAPVVQLTQPRWPETIRREHENRSEVDKVLEKYHYGIGDDESRSDIEWRWRNLGMLWSQFLHWGYYELAVLDEGHPRDDPEPWFVEFYRELAHDVLDTFQFYPEHWKGKLDGIIAEGAKELGITKEEFKQKLDDFIKERDRALLEAEEKDKQNTRQKRRAKE